MRKLVILRGAMGAGKSTFIKEHNLEQFTLSSDNFRLLFNSLELTADYNETIPQFNNKKVWELLYQILEERMKKGEFTIVDAVHAKSDTLTVYKKLAEKYRYRLYILDFTGISKEEVYKRNIEREKYKVVPKEAIDRTYKSFKKDKIPKCFNIIKPEDFESIIMNSSRDLNRYKNIHIFGDIHGCIEPLKEYFTLNSIRDEDAYIFVGDYFDRGIDNYRVFRFLESLMDRDNFIFLMGNHEDKLYKYASLDDFRMDYDIKKTIEEFSENGLSKSEVRGFIKKLSQIVFMNFRNKTYIISHGGIPYFPDKPLEFYSTNSFIYGIDKYETNIDRVYNDYMEKREEKVYQIHGHRNHSKVNVCEYEYSYNLEDNIEYGGNLVVLNLNDDGKIDYAKIKNDRFNKNLGEETECYNLVEQLTNNKYVYQKDLGNDIFSFNFTKEAFYNKVWDDLTTKARGLFIDIRRYRIIARSYEKFFKVGERCETKLNALKDTLDFPVNFYLKYNGFLGILSLLNDDLYFTTKSSDVGDYVDHFKHIFYEKFNDDQIASIKNFIKENDVSFIFEVLDPENDAHIIKYENKNLILLDIIYNRVNFKKLDYHELMAVSQKFDIQIKSLAYVAHDLCEFQNIYEDIIRYDYKFDDEYVEGFVLEDENNFMVKVKTSYYSEWKYLRGRMDRAIKNDEYNVTGNSELEKNFMSFIKNKYSNKDIDASQINIIQERDEFFRQVEQ